MTKAIPLHVLVRNLQNQLYAKRLPGQVLPLAPTALGGRPEYQTINRVGSSADVNHGTTWLQKTLLADVVASIFQTDRFNDKAG